MLLPHSYSVVCVYVIASVCLETGLMVFVWFSDVCPMAAQGMRLTLRLYFVPFLVSLARTARRPGPKVSESSVNRDQSACLCCWGGEGRCVKMATNKNARFFIYFFCLCFR